MSEESLYPILNKQRDEYGYTVCKQSTVTTVCNHLMCPWSYLLYHQLLYALFHCINILLFWLPIYLLSGHFISNNPCPLKICHFPKPRPTLLTLTLLPLCECIWKCKSTRSVLQHLKNRLDGKYLFDTADTISQSVDV